MQCRACLKTNCENTSRLDEFKIMCFNLITALRIRKDDSMPQQLCESCTKDLKLCVEFREKCITSNTILISARAKTSNEDLKITTQIKEEDIQNGLEQDVMNYNIDINKKEEIEVKDEYNLPQTEDNFVYEYMSDSKDSDDSGQTSVLKGNTRKSAPRTVKKEINTRFKKVHRFQKYDCGLCAEKLKKDKLCEHVKNHENNNFCGICSLQLKEWEAKLQHRISHLKKPNLICHICLRTFQSPVSLECHYNIKHLGKIEDGMRCKLCNKIYTSVRNLQRHMDLMHKNMNTYKCDDCSKVFPTKNAINYHNFKYHVKRKRVFCGDCDYTTELKSSMRKHKLRRHAAEKVFCKLCKALFADDDGLKRHKCKYSTQSICPVCGIVFEVPVKMMRHLETHSDERKHKCSRCDAAFKSSGALRVHLNKHDGVRAHRCEHCPATFWAHSTLNKHRRVHTGEKPYICKMCNKGFTANHNLKVHMRVHGVFNLIKKKGTEENPIGSVQECNKRSPIDYL